MKQMWDKKEIEKIIDEHGGSGEAVWGSITGTLSNQTDLQNALDTKADSTDLATVATTGDYDDLINKPVDLHYITVVRNGTMSEDDFALVQANPDKCVLIYQITETQVMYLKHVKTWVSSGTTTPTEYVYAGCYTVEVIECSINASNRRCDIYAKNITEVYGRNDGTNWTSLTIGSNTYNIPSGGEEIVDLTSYAEGDTIPSSVLTELQTANFAKIIDQVYGVAKVYSVMYDSQADEFYFTTDVTLSGGAGNIYSLITVLPFINANGVLNFTIRNTNPLPAASPTDNGSQFWEVTKNGNNLSGKWVSSPITQNASAGTLIAEAYGEYDSTEEAYVYSSITTADIPFTDVYVKVSTSDDGGASYDLYTEGKATITGGNASGWILTLSGGEQVYVLSAGVYLAPQIESYEDAKIEFYNLVENSIINSNLIPIDGSTITLNNDGELQASGGSGGGLEVIHIDSTISTTTGTLSATDLAKINANPWGCVIIKQGSSAQFQQSYELTEIAWTDTSETTVDKYVYELVQCVNSTGVRGRKLEVTASTGDWAFTNINVSIPNAPVYYDRKWYIVNSSTASVEFKVKTQSVDTSNIAITYAVGGSNKFIIRLASACGIDGSTTEPSIPFERYLVATGYYKDTANSIDKKVIGVAAWAKSGSTSPRTRNIYLLLDDFTTVKIETDVDMSNPPIGEDSKSVVN